MEPRAIAILVLCLLGLFLISLYIEYQKRQRKQYLRSKTTPLNYIQTDSNSQSDPVNSMEQKIIPEKEIALFMSLSDSKGIIRHDGIAYLVRKIVLNGEPGVFFERKGYYYQTIADSRMLSVTPTIRNFQQQLILSQTN